MPDPLEPSFEITFLTENPKETFPWRKRLETLGKRLLQEENCLSNVNVVLCSDKTVRELNRDYRHLDKVTDVLSFEQGDYYTDDEGYKAKHVGASDIPEAEKSDNYKPRK